MSRIRPSAHARRMLGYCGQTQQYLVLDQVADVEMRFGNQAIEQRIFALPSREFGLVAGYWQNHLDP